MKVRITDDAQSDLAGIAAWIARDNVSAAVQFGDALVAKALEIGAMPRAFPMLGQRDDLRKRSFRNHVIIYRVTDEVVILRIFDGRRDYLSLLDNL